MSQGKKQEAKKKMLLTLNDLVRKGLYRFKKFIEDEDERQIAAEWALSALGFPDMDERATAKWMETYEPHVVKFINSARGYAQTGIKKIMWENWGISVNKAIMDKSCALLCCELGTIHGSSSNKNSCFPL